MSLENVCKKKIINHNSGRPKSWKGKVKMFWCMTSTCVVSCMHGNTGQGFNLGDVIHMAFI